MAVEAFNSVDDMRAYLAGADERKASLTQAWQSKITYGDYFVLYQANDGTPMTYGYIPTVKQFSNEDPFNHDRNYVFAKLYNGEIQPDGLYESIHISEVDAIITAQQFKQLKAAHWPASIYTMLVAMYGVTGKPLIFMLKRDGQFLLNRTTQRIMYCVLDHAGLTPIDEAALNERYGVMGWNMIADYFIDERGKGGRLTWDFQPFLTSR